MDRLPGFRDFFPEPIPNADQWSAAARRHIFDQWRHTAGCYGFQEYDGPPLEPLELFTKKSGEEIVGQLYNFSDKGDREIALRPEMTPTLARMVATHARNYKKPIKWFAIPQLFRYERQQKGRLREHFQFNADIIGETDPSADSELIALMIDSLRGLGLTSEDFVIRLSSRDAWKDFFKSRSSLADSEEAAYEFYQAVDKLERTSPDDSQKKFEKLGLTHADVLGFIEQAEPTPGLSLILDNLAARGLSDFVKIDYGVIRGLAYYTGVVFEAFDRKGEFRAIAGGGRYDNLIKLISGGKVDLPALGFGMGDVVLLELLKKRKLLPEFGGGIKAFCLIEDESLRPESLNIIQQLRQRRCPVEYPLTPVKPDKQFKRALELKAAFTVRLEKMEQGGVQARVKNLTDRQEQILTPEQAVELLGQGE